jgi:probable phosphoglycerate mutase
MSKIYLIRHGANDCLGKSIAGRQAGVHLNASGQKQAARLAEHLQSAGISQIYSSPLERSRETAQPLAAKMHLEIQIADELDELQFGEWNGATLEELNRQEHWRKWNNFRSGTRIPGGEMMIEAQQRMIGFIQSLSEDYADETLALFSHGDPIRAALAYYLGIPLDFLLRFEVDPASINILTLSGHAPVVHCINQQC